MAPVYSQQDRKSIVEPRSLRSYFILNIQLIFSNPNTKIGCLVFNPDLTVHFLLQNYSTGNRIASK